MSVHTALSRAEFVRLVAGLCRLHRVPFAQELLLQHFTPDESGAYTFASVLDATDRFGLVAEEANLADVDVVADLRLPLIVFPIGAATEGNEAQAPVTPNLVLRAEGEQLRCLAAGAEPPQLPQLLSLPALKAAFSSSAWSFQLKSEPANDTDEVDAEGHPLAGTAPFGFRWFIPELLRHRPVWREILLASLALQLVGLITPLFTQVVIDKVVVHQTQSTLVAVGVGLFAALIFSSAFTCNTSSCIPATASMPCSAAVSSATCCACRCRISPTALPAPWSPACMGWKPSASSSPARQSA